VTRLRTHPHLGHDEFFKNSADSSRFPSLLVVYLCFIKRQPSSYIYHILLFGSSNAINYLIQPFVASSIFLPTPFSSLSPSSLTATFGVRFSSFASRGNGPTHAWPTADWRGMAHPFERGHRNIRGCHAVVEVADKISKRRPYPRAAESQGEHCGKSSLSPLLHRDQDNITIYWVIWHFLLR
jgi:hypothetical protein